MNVKENYRFDQIRDVIDALKGKIRLAVVHGGDKSKPGSVIYKTHNPRPWKSYEVVAHDIENALKENGFKNIIVIPDDMTMLDSLRKEKIDMVWLNTGGVQGYIPTAHGSAMLEMAGIPYVGHNPQNAGVLDNKHMFKYMLNNFGIKTSPFVVWSKNMIHGPRADRDKELDSVFTGYDGPFVIKPTSGRASLNIFVADNREDMLKRAEEVAELTNNIVVIEKYLAGKEYCVSVCGSVTRIAGNYIQQEEPFAFSVLERRLGEDERIFTSMDKKPITGSRLRICTDREDGTIKTELENLARSIYSKLRLETLVRVDLRADVDGVLHVLETNPKPDLKRPNENVTSLTCMGLEAYNMDYLDLIEGLFADKIHYLLKNRPKDIQHILDLL